VSLIGEALKRARLEAARREGEERGTAHSSMPAYLPDRRRFPTGWIFGLLAATVIGGAIAFFLLRTPPPPQHETAPTTSEPASPPTAGAAAVTPPAVVPILVPAAAATEPPAAEAPGRPSPPPPESSEGKASPAPEKPGPVTADPSVPAGARAYVGVAEIGGTRLELDGIVASATDPVAMINRKLLGIGEGLEGWVVEKIEAKQVTLRGGSETIVLRLR
jgi:hypothetical protein